jgi:hypothetical protein
MTLAAASEVHVRAEIWQSFVGVLKSYAAIAGMSGDVHAVSEGEVGTVIVESGPAYLSLAFDAEQGRGSYRLVTSNTVEIEEQFRLNSDGTISTGGSSGEEDLDHAAIRILALLAGVQKSIEVLA